MLNPYTPPASQLAVGGPQKSRHIGWKIYFGIALLLEVIYVFWLIYDPTSFSQTAAEYLNAALYVVVLVGLFGFVFYRKMLSQFLWRIFFPCMVAWDTWYNLIFVETRDAWLELGNQGSIVLLIIMVGFVLILMVPQYIAIFRYAFVERELWQQERSGPV